MTRVVVSRWSTVAMSISHDYYPTRLVLDKQGAVTPGEVVIAGDEPVLDAALKELEDAGVTTFLGTPFDAGDGAIERTREYLVARAKV